MITPSPNQEKSSRCYCKKCGALINPTDEKCPNGHLLKDVGRAYEVICKEILGFSDSIGEEHKLPCPCPLTFTKYEGFTQKIPTLQNRNLEEYHHTTKYRLLIAEYCLNLLLKNYDNSIAFAAGLTGFLVQAKSALDSLAEEINIRYSLDISNPRHPDWVTTIDEIIKPQNIKKLKTKKPNLAQILSREISLEPSGWFSELKTFRDQEGVHRKRSPRHITIGTPAHDIQIGGKPVAEYCVSILYKINEIIEECYGSMI